MWAMASHLSCRWRRIAGRGSRSVSPSFSVTKGVETVKWRAQAPPPAPPQICGKGWVPWLLLCTALTDIFDFA